MPRITWAELPAPVHAAVRHVTGPVTAVEPVTAGRNSDIAAVIHTTTGPVFAKGNRDRDRTQHLEAQIANHVAAVSPRLLWRVHTAGWHILGFDHVPGRRADLSHGSADLPKVLTALGRLTQVPPPDMELRRIEHRWAGYASPDDLQELAGDALIHTDLHPDNILITDQAAHFVDWAWPTLGAAWVDAACLALWLIVAGHTPAQAEQWAARHPAWPSHSHAIDTFTTATAGLWQHIAASDHTPWKQELAAAATHWSEHRIGA